MTSAPIAPSVSAKELAAAAASNERVNELEAMMRQLPEVECPVQHRFTPGLYVREVFVPAGTLVATKIHQTEHPFVISQGVVAVWTEDEGVKILRAPYTGITKPGTRRVVFVHEDCIWTTFHPTNETDLDVIEKQLIFPHEIPDALLARAAQLLIGGNTQ